MHIRKWEELPEFMKNDQVRVYYNHLKKHQCSLFLKRCFDLIMGIVLLILLSPILIIVTIWIKLDSPGPALFRQVRVTQYGKEFRIFKFRSMIIDAPNKGSAVTKANDDRITKSGHFIRKTRLDELPQLLNIIVGDMSFVGTRPEVPKYVNAYTDEMMATLLLPAGVTSLSSIRFKDESALLDGQDDVDHAYITKVLVEKMKINLEAIYQFSFLNDIKIMCQTVIAVIK